MSLPIFAKNTLTRGVKVNFKNLIIMINDRAKTICATLKFWKIHLFSSFSKNECYNEIQRSFVSVPNGASYIVKIQWFRFTALSDHVVHFWIGRFQRKRTKPWLLIVEPISCLENNCYVTLIKNYRSYQLKWD